MFEFDMLARCAAAGNQAPRPRTDRYRTSRLEPTYQREFFVPWHGGGMIQP